MKQEFEPHVIAEAVEKSYQISGDLPMLDVSINGLRAFLDALPEPQDDFQRGGVILDTDDVRKGDRVLIMNLANNLYEVTVTAIDERAIIWKGSSITKSSIDRIYLMDRPAVQHPDPAEHPVILVTEYDVAGNIMECEPTPFFAHDGVYKNDIYAHRPDDVLSWSPAKVVADNEN